MQTLVKMRLYISSVVSVLLLLGFPFIMTEVVNSFRKCSQFFLNGLPPVIPGTLENSDSKDTNYVLICQKFKNEYRFATLYDTANRIPVFSAYKFTKIEDEKPSREKRKCKWKIEPQLEPSGPEMKVPFVHQASKGDYSDLKNKQLTRGHLFPNGHAANDLTAESTYTLTNIVPQKERLNNGPWSVMEQKVKKFMNKYCHDIKENDKTLAYVLTGAVPGNNKLNERVNIPSYTWTVFCCYNANDKSFTSKAHWANNENDNEVPVQSTSRGKRKGEGKKGEQNKIPPKTLVDLETFLSEKYKKQIKLFDSCRKDAAFDKDNLLDKQTELYHVEDQGVPCEDNDA